ncbi:MAG: DNA-binding protein [Microvirga sp.]|jgi:excisionase family DNA binding protein|nr:DNA-binding protein [Microvirga sp.]
MDENLSPLQILAGSSSSRALAAALTGAPAKAPERVAYNIDEAAQASGLGRNGIYREINEGRLIARKYGRRTVILKEDLLAWIRSLPQLADA